MAAIVAGSNEPVSSVPDSGSGATMSNLGVPGTNPDTDTRDRDTHVNALHTGQRPAELTRENIDSAEMYAARLESQIERAKADGDKVDFKPAMAHPGTKIELSETQKERRNAEESIAEANAKAAAVKRSARKKRGRRVIREREHFASSDPFKVQSGDAWEAKLKYGKKIIKNNINAMQRDEDDNNQDLSWRPGKKAVGKHFSNDTGAGAAISGEGIVAADTPIKTGKRQSAVRGGGKQSPKDKKDQFEIRTAHKGKKQLASTSFASALKGAAGISVKPDQWEAKGSHTGKRQVEGTGNVSILQGATADVPAAEFQKLRVGIVKNSQRFVSNLGPGLAVQDDDGNAGANISERPRPQKKHVDSKIRDHVIGSRLSIHESSRAEGRQVSSEVTNRSHFIAPGIADSNVEVKPPRKTTNMSRVGTQGHLNRNMQPEPGSSASAKRQLKSSDGRNMYTTTQQVTTQRGRKIFGGKHVPAVGGQIGGNAVERPAAGKPSGAQTRTSGRRSVGTMRAPRTPGGNSQIVFG